MQHAIYQLRLNGDSSAERGCRYVCHIELRKIKGHNQFISHRTLHCKGFILSLREGRHLVNMLKHFTKHATDLALTIQQILKHICENTLQLKINLRNNIFNYNGKEYIVARLSICQMFVMQIGSSKSRSNVYSAKRYE